MKPIDPLVNYHVAKDFLTRFRPSGPWVLTATDPIETRTLVTLDELDAFLKEFNEDARRNVYFHVNDLKRAINGKARASKTDVARMAWFHVDVDPRVAEERDGNLADEQKRIEELMHNPPSGLPRPTVIVFSGGGYQGYWKLEDPIEIDGDEAKWTQAERYTKQIQTLYRCEDSCFNCDRIMRIPGSINWPNKKKADKGRFPVCSELVDFTDQSYPTEMFMQAIEAEKGDDSIFGGEGKVFVAPTGNIERIDDLAALDEWDVGHSTKELIIHGNTDDKKHGTRSEAIFAVVCQLVRAGVPDEKIFALITDPDWAISDSIFTDANGKHRSGKSFERYALRQINRAHEKVDEGESEADQKNGDALVEMNDRHAVIGNLGGKCLVIEEDYNEVTERRELSTQSFEQIGHRYANQVVTYHDSKGKEKEMELVKWWRKHPRRRQYKKMQFAPGRKLPVNILNLWQGFGVEAMPGDCALFLDHIRDNLCQGDDALYDYVIKWMAHAVQHPDKPGYTALVMRGDLGVGKTKFAKVFGRLFGQHYVPISNGEHLVGRFNAHMRDCSVLFADEAFYANDRRHASILKSMITSDTLQVEAKGIDNETCPNFVHLIMASNDEHVIPAALRERRFVVLEVSSEHLQDYAYFGALQDQMDNGGYEALLFYLLSIDLKGYNIREIPQTKGLRNQKRLSFSPEQQWWYEILERGEVLDVLGSWPDEVVCAVLYDNYVQWARNQGINRRVSFTMLSRRLKTFMPDNEEGQGFGRKDGNGDHHVEIDGRQKIMRRPRLYTLPPLGVCRDYWDLEFGGPFDWPFAIANGNGEVKAVDPI